MRAARSIVGSLSLTAGAIIVVAALASCMNPLSNASTITPIYAATAAGLSVYNGSGWTNYTQANTNSGLASDTVNAVSVVGSGSTAYVYAATNAGLSYNQGSGWSTLTTADKLTSNNVTGLFLGKNNLYLVTGGGLTVINYTTGAISTPSGPPWGTASVKAVFSNGETYLATTDGLWFSSGGTWQNLSSTLTNQSFTAVFVDSSSNVYAGTATGLSIWTASTGTWSTITIHNVTAVNSLFVDPYGDIYAGTNSGLYLSTDGGSGWTNYAMAGGASSNVINGIFVVGQSIYLATNNGLWVSTDGGTIWTSYTSADGLGSSTVNGVYVTAPLYSY